MKKIYHILLFLLSLLLITACSGEEENIDLPADARAEKNVTLEVKIPGVKTPTTYGMTPAQENNVNQLTVLAYKMVGANEILQQKIIASAADIDNDGTGNVTIKLAIPIGDYNRLVLVTNANTALNSLAIGSNLIALNALTYSHATGRWNANVANPDYIPMSGEVVAGTTNGIKIQQGVSKKFDNLKLIRMLARVDIRNNSAASFTLKEVMLYNMKRNGLIVSDATKYGATPPAPNLPATLQAATSPMTYNYATLKTGNVMNNEIYVFEAAAPTTPTIGTTSPRIILKGTYKTVDYFYPVDFTYDGSGGTIKGDFMPIVRNHQYIFTINKVAGPGFATAAEALAYPGSFTNIDVKVFIFDIPTSPIGEDFTDVYYDSQNLLAVNGVQRLLGPMAYTTAVAENTITVRTDVANFTITCYNNDGTSAASWLQPSAASYAGGSNVKAFLKSSTLVTSIANEKEGYIIVKAGSLQSDKIPVAKVLSLQRGTQPAISHH